VVGGASPPASSENTEISVKFTALPNFSLSPLPIQSKSTEIRSEIFSVGKTVYEEKCDFFIPFKSVKIIYVLT
jgi:hypothetical protein